MLALGQEVVYALGILLLRLLGVERYDLEIDLVLSHEGYSQTSKCSADKDQEDGDAI